MPTVCGPSFEPGFLGRPPGMSAIDWQIWDRWRPHVAHHFQRLWFNVGLGAGAYCPPETDRAIADMWQHNTQKRADVIAETETRIWLIELRDHASANALGRLLMYRDLYEQQPVSPKPLQLILVSNTRDDDLAIALKHYDVTYVIV